MSKEVAKRRRSARRQSLLLTLVFSLLPMFVVAGVLAPGFVKVQASDDDSIGTVPVRVSRSLSRFARQPILIPRDFSSGFAPDVLDLDDLFSGVDYLGKGPSQGASSLPTFPHSTGDMIVLDDTDQRMREIVFKDPVLMAHNSNLTLPPPAKDITPLDATGLGNSGPRFDDFLGPNFDPEDPVVVPEAETGILLGLGLVLLTIAGRERRA